LNKWIASVPLALAILVGSTLLYLSEPALVSAQAPTTYFVDCSNGRDGANGTSQSTAWKTLGRANRAKLRPGDTLRLKRGCTFAGPLVAGWAGTAAAPITINAYGNGALPVIQNAKQANIEIRGSNQIIEYLATNHAPGSFDRVDNNCNQQAYGWRLGAQFVGANNNVLRNSRLSGASIGVFVNDNSRNNRIMNNQIVNNTGLWDNLDSTGVLLRGDGNEIGRNHFQGNRSRCKPNKSISIELFNATNSNIHHNTAYGDRVFAELGVGGGGTARDNTIAYNIHTTDFSPNSGNGARFIVTHGPGVQFGPVWNTKLLNNTVYYTGSDSQGVVCQGACTADVVTLRNSIIVARTKVVYVGAGHSIAESHNLYWHPDGSPPKHNFVQNLTMASSSIQAAPKFVNPGSRNFHLRADSPAINRAGPAAINNGYSQDIDGDKIPVGGNPDIGVDEVTGAAASSAAANEAPADESSVDEPAAEEPAPAEEPTVPAVITIQAEDYRAGGEEVSYHDTTPGNSGGHHRTDDVDIQETTDVDGGFNLGWVDQGEWLDYDLHVSAAGQYVITLRLASVPGGNGIRLQVDGVDVGGVVPVPSTGGWQTWTDVTTGPIDLPAGDLTLTLVSEMQGVNVNYLTISPS
jgi:hypothetical protein